MWPVLQVFTPSVRKIHFRVVIPYTATAEVVRQFQIAQNETGRPTSTIDPTLSALSFFITRTLT